MAYGGSVTGPAASHAATVQDGFWSLRVLPEEACSDVRCSVQRPAGPSATKEHRPVAQALDVRVIGPVVVEGGEHGAHGRGSVEAGAALAGVLPCEVGHRPPPTLRPGRRPADDRDGAATEPASDPDQGVVVQRNIQDVSPHDPGEVAPHEESRRRRPRRGRPSRVPRAASPRKEPRRDPPWARRSGSAETCRGSRRCRACGTRWPQVAVSGPGWRASRRCDERGRPSTPSSKGLGGLSLGSAGPPLMARTAAVSSPATYAGSTWVSRTVQFHASECASSAIARRRSVRLPRQTRRRGRRPCRPCAPRGRARPARGAVGDAAASGPSPTRARPPRRWRRRLARRCRSGPSASCATSGTPHRRGRATLPCRTASSRRSGSSIGW